MSTVAINSRSVSGNIISSVQNDVNDKYNSKLQKLEDRLDELDYIFTRSRISRQPGELFSRWEPIHRGMKAISEELNSQYQGNTPQYLKDKFENIKARMRIMTEDENISNAFFSDDTKKMRFGVDTIENVFPAKWYVISKEITNLNATVDKLLIDIKRAVNNEKNPFGNLKGKFSQEWEVLLSDAERTSLKLNRAQQEEWKTQDSPQAGWEVFKRKMENIYNNYSNYLVRNELKDVQFQHLKEVQSISNVNNVVARNHII